mmetsp:Transcript_31416/g.77008  ORF Transcript_31416/g.77008 Transcript_31416/m.77008 type:complete len:251 (-) Transcript_31416:42-794(-)
MMYHNQPQFQPQYAPEQHKVVYARPDNGGVHGGGASCCAYCRWKTQLGLALYFVGWVLLVAGLAVTWWFDNHRNCGADKCDASKAWLAFGVLAILFSFAFVCICLVPHFPHTLRVPYGVATKLPLINRILQILSLLWLLLCAIMALVTNGMKPDTFGFADEEAASALTVVGCFLMAVAIILMGMDFFAGAKAQGIPVAVGRSVPMQQPMQQSFHPQPQFQHQPNAFQPSNAPPFVGYGGGYGQPTQYRSW